jgi:hypothetical protein
MKQILLVITMALFGTSAFAGRIHMASPDYSAIDDTLEAFEQYQYEQQLQAQLDAMAARQQEIENTIAARQRYVEELLQQNDDE